MTINMKPLTLLRPLAFLFFLSPTLVSGQDTALDREFLSAVENRNFANVETLLSKGANINAKEPINGHFALQYAIDWPDSRLVKLLLDKGANVNLADNSGYTALIDAARNNGLEYQTIVKLLLDHGANVHASEDAAIFSAAQGSDPEIMRFLLAKGAPANAKRSKDDGDTVLIVAASGGSSETVAMLLAAGADLKLTNNLGETALMKAVKLDHRYSPDARLPMIDLLLQKGADINAHDKNGMTPLLHSVVQYMSEAGGVISHPEVVRLLIARGADIQAKDLEGNTALLLTVGVWQGPIEIVDVLLSKNIDINAQNKRCVSALMVAADKGKLDVIQLLLQKGADLNLEDSEKSTALDHAVEGGYVDIAKLLLTKGGFGKKIAYSTEAGVMAATTNFALHRAVVNRNLAEVKTQLALGANVNSRGNHGYTPLLLAVEYSYSGAEIVTLLLEKGADPNLANDSGDTALMLAAGRNNAEAASVLLAHKARVYIRNQQQKTALHIAARELHASIVSAILASQSEVGASSAGVDVRGVEVDARDDRGRTPLMLAADNEGLVPDDVMKLLLEKGADLNAQDGEGNTALMLAAHAGSMAGVDYLLSRGANVDVKNRAGETALKLAKTVHENKRIFNADLVEARIVKSLLKAGGQE